MARKQIHPLGVSYRGSMAIQRGKRLYLPKDFHKFLTKSMQEFHRKEVIITIHTVEAAPDSIWDFMAKLGGPQAPDAEIEES